MDRAAPSAIGGAARSTPARGFPRDSKRLADRIIESDRIYFEMGADIAPLPGARIASVRGLAHCPSAVVVQRISAGAIARLGHEWVRAVEAELRLLGTPCARIYGTADDVAAAGEVLAAAGYEMRREIALVAGAAEPGADAIELREVETALDWRDKARFHTEVPERPDGHGASAADWVRLEQAKCSAGMRAFLAWRDGRAVGAIGIMPSEGPWRLKNIVVHSECRRQAVGRGMIAAVGAIAARAGASTLALFGVEGTVGEALYRACGFAETGFQIEWSKALDRSGGRSAH